MGYLKPVKIFWIGRLSSEFFLKVNIAVFQDRVVMGVYCSHDYDTPSSTYLKVVDSSSGKQYSCVCGPPERSPDNYNVCKLHVWHCPKES